MFRKYYTIYVLRGNAVEKSVDWTELFPYSLIVREKHYTRKICSVIREIIRFNSYLNKKGLISLFTQLIVNTVK